MFATANYSWPSVSGAGEPTGTEGKTKRLTHLQIWVFLRWGFLEPSPLGY